jgi:hypothetical protein
MSVTSNTLIGHSRGSIGNATMSTWKGLNVLKQKATSVANPNTGRQIMQRSAMTQIVAIFRLLTAVVDLGFKKGFAHMSPFNRFTKQNLKNSFDFSAPPVALFVDADFMISKGTITAAPILSAIVDDSANTITVNWDPSITGPGQSLTDQPFFVAHNITTDEWNVSLNGTRADGIASNADAASWVTGNSVQVWLGFWNPLTGESSDSTTIHTVIIA